MLQCVYMCIHIVCANVSVSANTKIICEVTLSLGLFSPQTLFWGASIKYGNFIKFGNEMLKINI